MAKQDHARQAGFSLVELLVAMLFTGILMAGMANVFKSSVSTLVTSNEGISSARNNRMSIDLLRDDLNYAGLFLSDLASPPQLADTNPSFYILPNVPIDGATADDPQSADQLFFYLDQPLPFEGSLVATGARSAAELVLASEAQTVDDTTFTIDCKEASYADMVRPGCYVVFKDSYETFSIATVAVSGKNVTITTGVASNVAVTGIGPSGVASKAKHIILTDVMFYLPAQVVRYSVKIKQFDPQKATGVLCLIRDQGTYSAAGFTPVATQEAIVTENVSGFKAYLSANSGQSWGGYGKTYTGFTAGWTAGIRAEIDTQLASAGRSEYTATQGDENWIRNTPTLVRLDITTRSATKRTEYSTTPLATSAYKDFTQSLVIVPRHFGLAMN